MPPATTLLSVPRPLALARWGAELAPGAACASGALPWLWGRCPAQLGPGPVPAGSTALPDTLGSAAAWQRWRQPRGSQLPLPTVPLPQLGASASLAGTVARPQDRAQPSVGSQPRASPRAAQPGGSGKRGGHTSTEPARQKVPLCWGDKCPSSVCTPARWFGTPGKTLRRNPLPQLLARPFPPCCGSVPGAGTPSARPQPVAAPWSMHAPFSMPGDVWFFWQPQQLLLLPA